MRGLLVKEFTMLRKQSIFLFVFPIMFLTINKSDPLFMLPLTTFFFCVIEINFMYSDEISKWQHYSLVLPVSRNTVVISKYLQIAITALSLGMMGIVLSFILSSMGICSLESGIIYSIIALSSGMLYPAFVLPLFFRFNVQKGKMVLTAINGIGVGVIGGFLSTINLTDELFGSVTSGLSSYIGVFLIIAAVVVILFTVSCLISVKIYEKRDL